MFTNLDFIHTRICYGFLNESNHQEYSVFFVVLDRSGQIKGDIMQNHEQKEKVKKSENPRFYGQKKLLF
jgi:hypothetical protein